MTPAQPAIVVFGSSSIPTWDPIYAQAIELGNRLAGAGFSVVNGGYFGLMGAVSRGSCSKGGSTLGVTSQTFSFRSGPNPWLSETLEEKNSVQRLGTMIQLAQGAIAMPGNLGTLNEILMLMTLWKVRESEIPLILWKNPFEKCLNFLQQEGILDFDTCARLHYVETPKEALCLIQKTMT
jgi:uncharacterized protein (TIGR00730 family)